MRRGRPARSPVRVGGAQPSPGADPAGGVAILRALDSRGSRFPGSSVSALGFRRSSPRGQRRMEHLGAGGRGRNGEKRRGLPGGRRGGRRRPWAGACARIRRRRLLRGRPATRGSASRRGNPAARKRARGPGRRPPTSSGGIRGGLRSGCSRAGDAPLPCERAAGRSRCGAETFLLASPGRPVRLPRPGGIRCGGGGCGSAERNG